MTFLGGVKNFTDNFISSLKLSKKSEELARILFKSREDCNLFYIKYLGRNYSIIDDLLDFREKKLSSLIKKQLKLEIIDNHKLNKKFLESAFIQPLSDVEASLIIDSILNGMITFPELYNKFIDYPNANIMKHVL